jgi:hypothetical protein
MVIQIAAGDSQGSADVGFGSFSAFNGFLVMGL